MANVILHDCIICGTAFRHRKNRANKFCGAACYHEAQRRGLVKVGREAKRLYPCHECGEIVNRGKSTRRNGEASDKVFCSRACYDKYRSAIIDARSHQCRGCGAPIGGPGISGKTLYCSQACKVLHKKPKPSKCLNCGVMFSAIKPQARANGELGWVVISQMKTCSPECHNQWIRRNPERKRKISEAFSKQSHPNWQGGTHRSGFRGHDWESVRRRVIERAGHKCEHCGMTESEHLERFNVGLNVNHKTPFHQHTNKTAANRLSNLEALCKSCHTKEDWKWRKTHPIQLGMDLR